MTRWFAALAGILLAVAAQAADVKTTDRDAIGYFLRGAYLESGGNASDAYQYYILAAAREPRDPAIALRVAELALEVGDLESATKYARSLIESGNRVEEAELVLAQALYRLDKREEAADILRRLLAKGGVDRFAVLKFLGRIAIDLERYEEAKDVLQQARALVRDDLYTLYQLGYVYNRLGKTAEAIEAFEAAVAVSPDFSSARAALAQLYVATGKRAEARRQYEAILELEPSNSDAIRGMTEILYRAGDYADGVKLLEPLKREGKLDEGGLLVYGRFLHKVGRSDDALAVFRALIDSIGERPQLLRVVSELEVETGRFKSAYGHLVKLVSLEPGDFSSYVGILLIGYGLAGAASSPAEEIEIPRADRDAYLEAAARRVDSSSVEDNYLLGAVLRKTGDAARAERFLLRAEELDGKHESALLELATLYGREQKFDSALKRIVVLHSAFPDNPTYANFYGYLLAEKGEELDRAEKLVRQALERDPENGYYLDSLGWIRFKQKRYRDALEILLGAVKRAGDDAVIWEHIGDTYTELGEAARAKDAYRESLKRDPAGPGVKEKLERIESGDARKR